MDAREKWVKAAETLADQMSFSDSCSLLYSGAKGVNYEAEFMTKRAELFAHLRTTPEGFALVPVEPTKAMLDAAEKLDWGNEDIRGNCCNMFMAMMAVADKPAPPKSEPL